MMNIARLTLSVIGFMAGICIHAQDSLWIDIPQEAKPYTRWWWLGSAVDEEGLNYNLEEFSKAGIGGVEITPIYGVQDNDDMDIQYLSSEWMDMLKYTIEKGESYGIETDMATGTGWPFGGPNVPLSEGACKAIFQQYPLGNESVTVDISCTDRRQKERPKLGSVMLYETGCPPVDLTEKAVVSDSITTVLVPKPQGGGPRKLIVLYIGRTQQMVKRAAPGGEGYVIDHFDKEAVGHYLSTFDKAFESGGNTYPHSFFNDSYEVYGADWTPELLHEFWIRHGYPLENYFDLFLQPDSLRSDSAKLVMSDYRETLGDMLLENFTFRWTSWAHQHGAQTRNQAHGSPANLLDLYSVVDIPECEGFGLTDFNIKGLRRDDGFTKPNDSDRSMMKYASSGAHVSGKLFTSSETFTWLTEHFRTSLSQCKPDLDLMFLSGVNHVYFHGSAYSPQYTDWPGWRFYASVDMSPHNPWWDAMPAFSTYIERCQAFLQWGDPDSDFLVYLPYYDMIYDQPGTVAMFDIHSMKKRAPKFIAAVNSIMEEGYDVDYVSDHLLSMAHLGTDERIDFGFGNDYAGIIIPEVDYMPLETLQKLMELGRHGCKVIFVGHYPKSVPGLGRKLNGEQEDMEIILKNTFDVYLADSYSEAVNLAIGKKEPMVKENGLSYIRRRNPYGYHYFISNLQETDLDGWVPLGVEFKDAVIYNPMSGEVGRAQQRYGTIRLQMSSGESLIIQTLGDTCDIDNEYTYYNVVPKEIELGKWTLTFHNAEPSPIVKTYRMDKAVAWTSLGEEELNRTMATGQYSTTLKIKKNPDNRFVLDAGDVREWVKVKVNGKEVATMFAVPYRCDITDYLVDGQNSIELDVTNLPANRIADMDRRGLEWRKFKEINVVDLHYQKTKYDGWEVMPSGLNSNPKVLVY